LIFAHSQTNLTALPAGLRGSGFFAARKRCLF
jgi:hypothetical protein